MRAILFFPLISTLFCFAAGFAQESDSVPAADSLSVADSLSSPDSVSSADSKPAVAVPDSAGEEGFEIEKPSFTGEEAEKETPATETEESLTLRSGEEMGQTVSRKTAFFSLLFPGLGEYRIGQRKLGKSLIVADAMFWTGLFASLYYRSEIMGDLRAYLYAHGACNGKRTFSGKDAWDLNEAELELPLYADSSAFYEQRVYMPSRDEYMRKIDYYWQWDSEADHQTYYDLWRKASSVRAYGYYFIGAALLTRVVSFINTGRLIRKMGVEQPDAQSRLEFTPYFHPSLNGLTLTCRF